MQKTIVQESLRLKCQKTLKFSTFLDINVRGYSYYSAVIYIYRPIQIKTRKMY